jgi:hypothetical protein
MADADDPVPRLPRGRGLKLSGPELFRISVTAAMLVAVVVLARPCANAVSGFVTSFEGSAKGSAVARPDAADEHYIRLKPGMTDEQMKEEIRKAREQDGVGSAR